jgi:nucleoside-diphosphate-sugar epimerase
MKLAIVAGGNGLIGRALITQLVKNSIPVVVIGSSNSLHPELDKFNSKVIKYLKVSNASNFIDLLSLNIKKKFKFHRNCVFFNLAWKAGNSLMDGDVSNQLKNIKLSSDFLKLAKQIKACKYIVAGSMEELILERYVNNKFWTTGIIDWKYKWYALSKVSSRMLSAFQAYHQKIDFCYTRISVVINKNLTTPKFVEQSLRNILSGSKVPKPRNKELCNLSSSEEIARQLLAISEKGINNKIYVLGTGETATLHEYFIKFYQMYKKKINIYNLQSKRNSLFFKKQDFAITDLIKDTGYKPKENYYNLFKQILKKL